MCQNTCSTCVHYQQHYALGQRKIFRVYCGHCTYTRVRKKRPDAKICENYVQAEDFEKPFVTKEYLSKALLEYILNLELLPEIYDADS